MILEEIIGAIIDPVFIIFMLIIFYYFFKKRVFLILSLLFFIMFGIFPLNKILNESLLVHDEWNASDVTGFIILGGNNDRVLKGLEIAKNYPDKKVIFTGGKSLFSETSQAQKAKFFLSSVRNEEILYESKSVNTFENAKFTYEKFKPGKDLYIIVTSDYHYKRSVEIFKKVGWNVKSFLKKDENYNFFKSCCGYGPFHNLYQFTDNFSYTRNVLREYVALLYYRFKY